MRLQQLKNLHDITEMRKLVWEECEDMHALFHTATPAFRYQTEVSQQIAQKILEGHGPTSNGVITLDAGANVHVFFPIEELPQWKAFARLHYPDISVIADEQGEGARFVPVADFSIEVPAKWVLSGEHSVLRGKRAVAFPYPKFYLKLNYFSGQNAHFPKQVQKLLDRAIIWLQKNNLLDSTPELKGTIEMQGNIPIGAGLGSSAALCVAVAHFILWKTQNDVSHAVTLATHLEDLFHGKSSGMDVHAISGSSPIIYSRNKNGEASVESLALNRTPRFEIYDTGMRGSTRECIEKLAGSTAPEANALDEQMGRATELAYEALLRFENEPQVAEKSLAQAMQMAQNCFESWGLVSPELLKQKNELINQGALAVKLTGAGMGGFWVALWPS